MPRSECNKTPLSNCKNSGCVVVKKGGSPHHCRSRPRKRKDSPPPQHKIVKRKSGSKKSSLVDSAKRKILKAIKTNQQSCSNFSLKQRNGTCYLAASTLLFARSALKECNDTDVRNFVRRTMANAWDDAQGPKGDVTCPRIPQKIRDYYSAFLDLPFYKNRINVNAIHEANCVTKGTCLKQDLINGGSGVGFLIALFWASGIKSYLTRVVCKFVDPMENFLLEGEPAEANGGTLSDLMRIVVGSLYPDIRFNVIFFRFEKRMPRNLHQMQKMEDFLNDCTEAALKKGYALQGALLGLIDKEDKKGHLVSAYPCMVGGRTKWISCNSWGENCSPTLFDLMRDLRRYDFVFYDCVTILLKRI